MTRTTIETPPNWPMLSAERCLEKLDEIGLDQATTDLFLSGNARVFRL
jgi:uncharacterized protein